MSQDPLIINFVGDLCLQGIRPESFHIADEVHALLAQGHLNIANLESPLTRSEDGAPGQPIVIKAAPASHELLDMFHAFTLANNHILDYGQKGLAETISFLEESGKSWFGGGRDIDEAFRPLKIERDGVKLALIGFTRWSNARGARGGTTPEKIGRLKRIVRQMKREGCFVILCAHWNYEFVDYPSPIERARAHKLIDGGADAIIGSHPHYVQGYEQRGGKQIVHSLGNFVFHSSLFEHSDRRLHEGMIVTLQINADHTYSTDTTPTFSDDTQLRLLNLDEKEAFEKRFKEISNVFINNRGYKKVFYRDAARIARTAVDAMASSSTGHPILGYFKRIYRVQLQDILIVLHSMLGKK